MKSLEQINRDNAPKPRQPAVDSPALRVMCDDCFAFNVWDRVLYLDADGEVTTYSAAKQWVESRLCLTCNTNQSLGPSTLTPDVAIEIRATELAVEAARRAETEQGDWIGWLIEPPRTGAELQGWCRWAHHKSDPIETDAQWAGWLAREIFEHDTVSR